MSRKHWSEKSRDCAGIVVKFLLQVDVAQREFMHLQLPCSMFYKQVPSHFVLRHVKQTSQSPSRRFSGETFLNSLMHVRNKFHCEQANYVYRMELIMRRY